MIPTLQLGALGRRQRNNPALIGSVTSLMAADAAAGQSSIVDALGNAYTASAPGGGSATTAVGVPGFGGAALQLSGIGRFRDTTANSNYQVMASGAFTVELLLRFSSLPSDPSYGSELIGNADASNFGFLIRAMPSGELELVFPNVALVGSVLAPTGAWQVDRTYHAHWSCTGNPGSFWLGIDGASTDLAPGGGVVVTDGASLTVGSGSGSFSGNLAWRLTKGLARYPGATYTPPGPPFGV